MKALEQLTLGLLLGMQPADALKAHECFPYRKVKDVYIKLRPLSLYGCAGDQLVISDRLRSALRKVRGP